MTNEDFASSSTTFHLLIHRESYLGFSTLDLSNGLDVGVGGRSKSHLFLAGTLLFMEIRATPLGMKVCNTVNRELGHISGLVCCSFPILHPC